MIYLLGRPSSNSFLEVPRLDDADLRRIDRPPHRRYDVIRGQSRHLLFDLPLKGHRPPLVID